MDRTDRRLIAGARRASAAVAVAVGIGVLGALLAVAQAWLLASTIAGAVVGGEGVGDLAVPLAWLAAVFVARAGLAWSSEVVAQRISGDVRSDLRRSLLTRAAVLGPRWASEARSGEVVLLATRGLDALDGYFARYLPQLALAAIVPVVVVACLGAVDPIAGLTVAITVPLIPVFMVLIGRMSAVRRRRRWDALGRLAHRFLDVVAGATTLRAYGRAGDQTAILRRVTDAYRVETMGTLRVAFVSALVLELLATLSVALVAVGIGLRLAAGQLTLEVGLFAITLAPEAYLPLRRLGAEFHASEEGHAAAAKAFEVIDASPPPSGSRTDIPALAGGSLAVRGLSVVQPGRDLVAPFDVSFEVRPGEVVAIGGPSGSGKSTLLAVLLGLIPPVSGRVLLVPAHGPEVDLASLDGEAWRRRVAWVPQVPYLSPGTIAANVRLGAPDAPDRAVHDLLAEVGLAEVDPDALVGEGGRGLSSGQRRRVGVARALLRQADLLLLDEPTAGLDPDAEAAVLRAVRRAADAGAAVVLVAHRPAAAASADRIVEVAWRSTPAAEDPVLAAEDPVLAGGTDGSAAGDGAAPRDRAAARDQAAAGDRAAAGDTAPGGTAEVPRPDGAPRGAVARDGPPVAGGEDAS